MRIKRGITIIETMIALFILALMGGAIISLTLQILAANNSAKLKNQAAAYVQQALEQVRGNYQNYSWLWLSGKAGCWQSGDLVTVGDCTNGDLVSGTVFKRFVQVTLNGSQIVVIAKILWTDRSLPRETSETTYYYNY